MTFPAPSQEIVDAVRRYRRHDPTLDTVDLARLVGIALGYEVSEAAVVRALDADRDAERTLRQERR